MHIAIASERRKPRTLMLLKVAFNFSLCADQSLDPRLYVSCTIMRRSENCDLRRLNQLCVRFVHTAIRCHQKPTLAVAELDDLRIFHALRRMFRVVITKMIRETLHTHVASILETFTVRLAESIFKKQNARFVVFFDQSGLMPV